MTRTTLRRAGPSTAVVALTFVLVSLTFLPVVRAGATVGVDLATGTYTSTQFVAGLGIALTATNDDFATDPFTNNRWQRSDTTGITYSGGTVLIGDFVSLGTPGRIRTVATFTLTETQSFTMDFKATFEEKTGAVGGPGLAYFGMGTTAEDGSFLPNDFAALRADIDFTNNCVQIRGAFAFSGTGSQLGASTACSLSYSVQYQGRVTYFAGNTTLLGSLGPLSFNLVKSAGTYSVNRPFVQSDDENFQRVTVDDIFRVVAPSGNYVSANMPAGDSSSDVLSAIAVDTSQATATDYVDNVYVLDNLGSTVATYAMDITTSRETVITQGDLSSGSLEGLGGTQIAIRVDLVSGAGISPVVSAIWVVTNEGGGGGVGGPGGGQGQPPQTIIDLLKERLIAPLAESLQRACDLWLALLFAAVLGTVLVIRHVKGRGDPPR